MFRVEITGYIGREVVRIDLEMRIEVEFASRVFVIVQYEGGVLVVRVRVGI